MRKGTSMRAQILRLVVAALIGFGLAAAASAADMSYRAPPTPYVPYAPPAPIYNWTGFYIGANVGWLGENDSSGTTNFMQPAGGPGLASNPQAFSPSKSGFTGGGQFGYNWQFAPLWVVGIETDWNGANPSSSFCRQTDQQSIACADNGFGFVNGSEKTEWLAT